MPYSSSFYRNRDFGECSNFWYLTYGGRPQQFSAIKPSLAKCVFITGGGGGNLSGWLKTLKSHKFR